MEKDTRPGRIQNTIDDLKRRLQQEREESETLTHHLSIRRDQAPPVEDSRMKKLETDLAAAHKELAERKESAEQLRQQLAAERALKQAGQTETDPRIRQLGEELAAAQHRFQEQKSAAEQLIQQLAAERDESRSRLREMETWTRTLEDELAAARQQLNDQQQAAETIRQLTAERDESRAQLSEFESRMPALEKELVAAQEQFREQRETAVNVIQSLEAERDELRAQISEQGAQAQKLEEELATTRNQLQEQVNVSAAAGSVPGGGLAATPDSSLNGRTDLWRMAASLTLVLMSSDLLAMNRGAFPETEEAVREIQLGSQKLLEFLRNSSLQPPQPQAPKPDQPGEAPSKTTGSYGTITPA